MSPLNDYVLSADDIPIYYEVQGDGKPVLVFIHGWCCNRSHWREQLGEFAHQYKVVAVDLAGHGESGRGRKAWTMSAFGEDVVAVVENLGLDNVVLIGHSMGGSVIVEAALRIPERVIGLIGVDTFQSFENTQAQEQIDEGMPSQDSFLEVLLDWVHNVFPPGSDPALIQKITDDMSAAPLEIALDALYEMGSYRNKGAGLLELKKPAITINRGDKPSDVEAAREYGMEVVFQPDVGHFGMLEDPENSNRLLSEAVVKLMNSNVMCDF